MVGPNSIGATKPTTIKFLCSYGGKILPRYPDGKLRYLGGETRVLAVNRSIPFSELLLKLAELCGSRVVLRCQLPTEDLDALVSITSDEDLANLVEEYDRAASPPSGLKIRAFLSLPKLAAKKPTSSPSSSASSSSPRSPPLLVPPPAATAHRDHRCLRQIAPPPTALRKSGSGRVPYCAYHRAHGSPSHIYLIHNGNHWQ